MQAFYLVEDPVTVEPTDMLVRRSGVSLLYSCYTLSLPRLPARQCTF